MTTKTQREMNIEFYAEIAKLRERVAVLESRLMTFGSHQNPQFLRPSAGNHSPNPFLITLERAPHE